LNISFRILLTVYAVCLTLIALIVMIIALWPSVLVTIVDYIFYVVDIPYANFIIFVVAFLFLSISLIFLFSGIRKYKEKKAISRSTNIGEIKISLETIENIALAVTRKIAGIKDIKTDTSKTDEGVTIELKVVLLPDVNIPSLSEEIQKRVKQSVESTAGIIVSNVSVAIDSVYTGYRSRVE